MTFHPSTPSSCTIAVWTAAVWGTSALPGSNAGCFLLAGDASVDAAAFPHLLLAGAFTERKNPGSTKGTEK